MSKLVLLFLLFFSVLSWAIIIDKFRAFRKLERENHHFLELFRGKLSSFEHIYRQSQNYSFSSVAQMFRSGYRQILAEREHRRKAEEISESTGSAVILLDQNRERILFAIEQTAREEMNFLEKLLTFLATAGSVSPFIGLFGTVWGIMNSFRGLGIHGSASIGVVAPGIAEALIATAAGLAAAIPAVIAYNHFLGRLNSASEVMSDFTREFMGRLVP
ncbi:MotA/TolQ/ExbB proton channel family protein [bacterium]|nr:MotA/TolQ/ExbB proton channel family protein [bacterium]